MMPESNDTDTCDPEKFIRPSSGDKDLSVQLVLSLTIGATALVAFCILRPRWPELYAARKRRLEPKIRLPTLPDSFLGWIPKLYMVTEREVLASAGLDAFVFLNFFKMAIRLFAIMAFFATAVLSPINVHYRHFDFGFPRNGSNGDIGDGNDFFYGPVQFSPDMDLPMQDHSDKDKSRERTFLWAYVIFTYFFVALTIYSINWETFKVIKYRQEYLGSQSTVTDRTFRLTGIPAELKSEEKIKNMIEKLDIGTVDAVTICRDWTEIDNLMDARKQYLLRLEAAWAKLLRRREKADRNSPSAGSRPHIDEESGENTTLLEEDDSHQAHLIRGDRPKMTIGYGLFNLRSRQVDAIDYYEDKLRRADAMIMVARKKQYPPTDMALVTMDSVASCQMVIQARIDPRPGRLLTTTTPAPSDLVWRNTYAPRGVRRMKSWMITIFITFLTLVWIFPTAFLASLLSICTVRKVVPSFTDWLTEHQIMYSLFQNGLPTLVVSLLNVAVPYLYDWLSNCQGMISQGDVELSLISKNFFFTFFNTFFVFAVSRTGFDFWSVLQGFLKDTSQIPAAIAADVEDLSIFYISFIMLQGIGLMPFRILEVGSVFLHPIYRMMSATPRDFDELRKPPIFQYGFYLPTALLVFNLCLIYSVLRMGFAILIVGTIYFALGYFTFKYMVLYAMDQPQHATGGAWRIICYRIVIGLLVFEVVMIGQIASLAAFVQSVFILPLIPFTIWYSYYFKRRFEPLTRYIALRSIETAESTDSSAVLDQEEGYEDEPTPRPTRRLGRRGSTLDEYMEKGLTFVNPSLVVPLQQPWIYEDPPPPLRYSDNETDSEEPTLIMPSTDSSLGIGNANVWRNINGNDSNDDADDRV